MRAVHEVSTIRAAESALLATTAEGTLMQRAAFALAVHCVRELARPYGARVLLLVGTGNNGGDALYAGAELARRGAQVTAVPLDADRMHDGGRAALLRAGGRLTTLGSDRVAEVDLVVDGLFGIGGRGNLDGRAAALAALTHARATIAVDIPSGVDAETGAVGGRRCAQIRRSHSARSRPGWWRRGRRTGPGSISSISVWGTARVRTLFSRRRRAASAQEPGADDDKYTRGVVGVVAVRRSTAGQGCSPRAVRWPAEREWCVTSGRARRGARALPRGCRARGHAARGRACAVLDRGPRAGDGRRRRRLLEEVLSRTCR